jgi:hypothetical protein
MSTFPGERCQHIKLSGSRCGAPALRDQQYCRFHQSCFAITIDVSTSATVPRAPFLLPALEDATSIQVAITQVCEHLLHRRLDPNKAGVLLYAMQVASANLNRLQGESANHKNDDATNDGDKNESGDNASTEPSTNQDAASGAPDRLPPGTIHACEQPTRHRSVG